MNAEVLVELLKTNDNLQQEIQRQKLENKRLINENNLLTKNQKTSKFNNNQLVVSVQNNAYSNIIEENNLIEETNKIKTSFKFNKLCLDIQELKNGFETINQLFIENDKKLLPRSNLFLYIIICEGFFFYVGITKGKINNNGKVELDVLNGYKERKMKNEKFSEGYIRNTHWLDEHEPIGYLAVKVCNDLREEDLYTMKLMDLVGWDRVRGGSFSNLELNTNQLSFLELQYRHINKSCFKCGILGHYAYQCFEPNNLYNITKEKLTIPGAFNISILNEIKARLGIGDQVIIKEIKQEVLNINNIPNGSTLQTSNFNINILSKAQEVPNSNLTINNIPSESKQEVQTSNLNNLSPSLVINQINTEDDINRNNNINSNNTININNSFNNNIYFIEDGNMIIENINIIEDDIELNRERTSDIVLINSILNEMIEKIGRNDK